MVRIVTGWSGERQHHCLGAGSTSLENKKKRKTYAFRRQFNEKPSIILGCPGLPTYTCDDVVTLA